MGRTEDGNDAPRSATSEGEPVAVGETDEELAERLRQIAAIPDPIELIKTATLRLDQAQREITELARLRRRTVQALHDQGQSHAQIAEAAGISRARIHQVRHTSPASMDRVQED